MCVRGLELSCTGRRCVWSRSPGFTTLNGPLHTLLLTLTTLHFSCLQQPTRGVVRKDDKSLSLIHCRVSPLSLTAYLILFSCTSRANLHCLTAAAGSLRSSSITRLTDDNLIRKDVQCRRNIYECFGSIELLFHLVCLHLTPAFLRVRLVRTAHLACQPQHK